MYILFQIKNKQLEGKLASTEATVRCQAEKMKCYRGMLETAGLIPKGTTPRRSHSESNLSTIASEDSGTAHSRMEVADSNDNISVSKEDVVGDLLNNAFSKSRNNLI